ncbi:MAG TPA: tRNA lysidine(34) synthetase TilS [Mycobacteriales bacterium]|nr:tRNA lysidine(34) synthetase TilS [Mycobacteriales bacterium]
MRRSLADLPAGTLVVAAVSGGADSVALAAALARIAPRAGFRAGAVTVDHGLQNGSAERAAAVALWAARIGLAPVETTRVDVVQRGTGPEAAARDARYAVLDSVAERLGATVILLGHTRDDQAESVLLGLARGSGARSLAGMAPIRGHYRRPLLDLPRATMRAACAAECLPVWDDPHNRDPKYARSRVRHQALPVLEAALGPGVARALARTAALLRADAEALDVWADMALADADPLSTVALTRLPAGVRSRVLRRAALDAGAPPTAVTAAHVAAMDRLVTAWRGQGPVSLPGGLVAVRAYGRLRFDAPDPSGPARRAPGRRSGAREPGGDRPQDC